jgi:CheY-like chemotaxis protein
MHPANLLIVDDDLDLCNLVSNYLREEGFAVDAVYTGREGELAAANTPYQLIILDVMLPDKKGFDVLKEIRAQGRCPVLMLTARGDEFDRVLGLELGADDYLSKPFSPRELVARIGAILHRSGWQSESGNSPRPRVMRSGDLELDPRYMPSTSSNVAIRIGHALAYTVVDRTDSGRRTIAVSNFAAAGAGGLVGMAYRPNGFNDATHAESESSRSFQPWQSTIWPRNSNPNGLRS